MFMNKKYYITNNFRVYFYDNDSTRENYALVIIPTLSLRKSRKGQFDINFIWLNFIIEFSYAR